MAAHSNESKVLEYFYATSGIRPILWDQMSDDLKCEYLEWAVFKHAKRMDKKRMRTQATNRDQADLNEVIAAFTLAIAKVEVMIDKMSEGLSIAKDRITELEQELELIKLRGSFV